MLFNQNLSLAKIFSVVLTLSIVSITVQAQIRMSNRSNEYAERREEIVAKDSLHSFSSSITLSAKEESVNRKLTTLRKEMMHYYDSINFFPPAHSFYKSIAHIYSTPLFSILKQMPKGGILHLHPSAGVSYRWVIEQALQEPNCYVYWQPDNKDFLKGQLHFYKNETAPKGFYRIKSLQDSIPGFTNELYKLLTFDETIRKDSVDIWREFGKRFNRVGGFTSYQPVYEKLLVSMFDSLVADGVQHVELRSPECSFESLKKADMPM